MWITVILFVALLILIVIAPEKERYQSYKKYDRGVMNHDAAFRQFVYRTDKSADEIQDILLSHNVHTSIKYRFHDWDQTIIFYSQLPDGHVDIAYRIYVAAYDGYSILKVVQVNHFLEKNRYALLQNEFWYQLLGAMPIPYT